MMQEENNRNSDRFPEDQRNTAPETRARFEYQDECIALVAISRLLSSELEGILVEQHTDLILIPLTGLPEFISIKHREANHRNDPSWTWSALKNDSVIEDLYSAWKATEEGCTVAFLSNAGFSGPAKELWRACTTRDPEAVDLVSRKLTQQLSCPPEEATQFLAALSLLQEPLPRRKEITDVSVRRLEDLLAKHGRERRHASRCYQALIDEIRISSTDIPESRRSQRVDAAATFREQILLNEASRCQNKYLSSEDIISRLLRLADTLQAEEFPRNAGRKWVADSLFTGRAEELDRLRSLLSDNRPSPTSPVVIHGLTGCGKTSLALHFAAKQPEFRCIFIDASIRSKVKNALSGLGQTETPELDSFLDSAWHFPVTPTLPETSNLLIILDGVTDSKTIQGLVPRLGLCRVLITSTVPHLDDGFTHIHLNSWKRSESIEYVSQVLTEWTDSEIAGIASDLHDHPLAIAQAANYCRLLSLTYSEYAEKLARSPVTILGKGEASGYPNSVIQAVQLVISVAAGMSPLARDLLVMLSYMGSDHVPEEVFTDEPFWPFVGEYPTVDDNTSSFKGSPWDSRCSLRDQDSFDIAVETLTRLSLINREPDGLITHPLVRLITRRTARDPVEWLRASLGILVNRASPENADPAGDLYMSHLEVALQIALDEKIYGSAIIASASMVANRLVAVEDFVSALNFILPLFEEVDTRAKQGLFPLSGPYGLRLLAINALGRLGRATEARNTLDEVIDIANSTGEPRAISDVWSMAGRVARWNGDRQLAITAHDRLSDILPALHGLPEQSIVVRHNLTQLLAILNRHEEANAQNQMALAELDGNPAINPELRSAIFSDAAFLARVRMDIDALVSFESLSYAIALDMNKNRGTELKKLQSLISLAEAAIDANDVLTASKIIREAGEGLDSWGYTHPIVGFYNSAKGRLEFVKFLQGSAESLHAAEEALVLSLSLSEGVHRTAPLVHLAQVYTALHRHDEAIELAKEAVDIEASFHGSEHPETVFNMKILSFVSLPCFGCSFGL